MTKACDDCAVRDLAVCAPLDDAELEALSKLGRRRRLARGEPLVFEGDDNPICANVLGGVLRVDATTPGGREQTVALLYPADFLGRPYAPSSAHSVTALTDVELCVFPRGSFERALGDLAPLENQLLRRTFDDLDRSRRWMLLLSRKSAEAKVASLLGDMAQRLAPQGGRFDLPLTRGEMADVLGLTIETVSRQLTKLARGGMIALHGRRGIELIDAETLAERAEVA